MYRLRQCLAVGAAMLLATVGATTVTAEGTAINLASAATTNTKTYRLGMWGYMMPEAVNHPNWSAAVHADLANVFATTRASVSITDMFTTPDTTNNVTVVFSVRPSAIYGPVDGTTFLASPIGLASNWTTWMNRVLYAEWLTQAARSAAAATDGDAYYRSVYINQVELTGSAAPVSAPKTRYFRMVVRGKYMAAAVARAEWAAAIRSDLGGAFNIISYIDSHLNVTAQEVQGTVLVLQFAIAPVESMWGDVIAAVNATKFVRNTGVVSWLAACTAVHTSAAYAALGIATPAPSPISSARGAQELGTVSSADTQLTVTSAGYGPGDEDYQGAGATGVTGAFSLAAATAVAALFFSLVIM